MSKYKFADKLPKKVNSIQEYMDSLVSEVVKTDPGFELVAWNIRDFHTVSTMHDYPIGQSSTGWGRIHIKEIGWEGDYHCKSSTPSGVWDWMSGEPLGFNSGSGGSGHYAFRLFLKDFPKIHKRFSELTDKYKKLYSLKFSSVEEDRIIGKETINNIKELLDFCAVNYIKLPMSMFNAESAYNIQSIKWETHRIPSEKEWLLNQKENVK